MRDSREQERDVPFAPSLSYRAVLEDIREYAVFVLTRDNLLASWSRGVEGTLGYTREEFIGQKGTILFVPEDVRSGVPDQEMATARRDGVAGDNRWHLKKDGSRFWANGVMSALTGDDGEVFGYVKVMRDNTAQKEAEDALQQAHGELERRVEERTAELRQTVDELRRSERLFAAIFRAGPFAAAVISGAERRFVEVNEVFCRLSGYTGDEVVGMTIDDMTTGYSSGPTAAAQGSDLDSGFRDRELEFRTKGDEVRTVLASEVEIPLNGEGGRLLMFFDITERKRGEEELMQAIQDVMQDASWFSRSVVERLAEIRSGRVDHARVGELTRRERQVLEQLARGRSNAEIAQELGIATQTVRNYITSVYEKIGVKSRVEAVVWARERGLGL